MPALVEAIRKKIEDSLRKGYKDKPSDWYVSTSWAIVNKRIKEGKIKKPSQ